VIRLTIRLTIRRKPRCAPGATPRRSGGAGDGPARPRAAVRLRRPANSGRRPRNRRRRRSARSIIE